MSDIMLTSERGVVVRNIKRVSSESSSDGSSYTFEAFVYGKWVSCSQPVGDWSYIDDYGPGVPFSVPVGWWELSKLYLNQEEQKREGK